MNVFILNAGRCGSSTFIQACTHISNFSCGHETLSTELAARRLDYPQQHIEADNRLSWLLGRLDESYGDNAFYVHLKRQQASAVSSFAKRVDFGILNAYRRGILMHHPEDDTDRTVTTEDIAKDYLATVSSNIECFLRDKSHKMDFRLEHARTDFTTFWSRIAAQGDIDAAVGEWHTRYNASPE